MFGVSVLSMLIGAGLYFALDLLLGARSMRRQVLPYGWRWEITRDGFVLMQDASGQFVERGRVRRDMCGYITSRGGCYQDIHDAMARVEQEIAMVGWRGEVP